MRLAELSSDFVLCFALRIERFWGDLWHGAVKVYYDLFCGMTEDGILEPSSDIDCCALHHVFMPRIQRHLDNFVESYKHHPLRTENNKTPYQLWIEGTSSGESTMSVMVRNHLSVCRETPFTLPYNKLTCQPKSTPLKNLTVPYILAYRPSFWHHIQSSKVGGRLLCG